THFHITSGAASRAHDITFLRRNLPNRVTLTDVTEDFCTLGVMGATSGATLEQLGAGIPWAFAPMGQVRDFTVEGQHARATRVSFVGEYGWELTLPNFVAETVFDKLVTLGAMPLGHYALDGCRIEKGFRHWGHDIDPTVTPLEAGLGFTIDWNKNFKGKETLLAQKEQGVQRRLILMQIEGEALMLHDEPVFEGGQHVGFTTSGARGPRTGLNLCFALVSTALGETKAETCARIFTVKVAGKDYAATPLSQAPFDPNNERMRGQ
ncbi:MAG: aminomethyltransferase family protein, partial [Arenibacterium sp.]